MRPFRAFRIICAVVCLATPALAQYTLKKIVFNGTTPYTQAALEAASGLKPGDTLNPAVMQQAAQRLSDTGAFGDLQVTLDGPVKAISIIFKFQPIDPAKTVVVDLENFIWWQPDELAVELRKRVPLFSDSLPEAGNLQQAVQDALSQMLAEKQIAAKLSSRITDATPGQPLRIVHYRVDSPDIRLHAIVLKNVPLDLSPQIDKLTAALAGSPYRQGVAGNGLTQNILNVYRDAGYLDASFDHLDRVIDSTSPGKIDVDLSGSIKAGEPYHVAKIDWAGSPLIGEKEFADASKLHPGDLASQKQLHASLALIDAAYRRQGYMDVSVDGAPQLDTAAHLVSYAISVNPGVQYHLSEINASNLAPDTRRQFDAAWKLHPGDLYDETYLASFIKSNIALPYLQPYSLSYRVERDPDNHLVKLFLIFVRGAK